MLTDEYYGFVADIEKLNKKKTLLNNELYEIKGELELYLERSSEDDKEEIQEDIKKIDCGY